MKLNDYIIGKYGREIGECSNEELYYALLMLTQEKAGEKISDKGKAFSGVEEPLPSGLRMRSEDKEGSKKRRTGHGRQHPTQQSKANYQSDRVRCQLSRTKT